MCEAGAAEVLPNRLGEPLVLSQDHSARERGFAGTQAGGDAGFGAGARAVQCTRDPAAARAGRANRARQQHGVRPAAALEVVRRPQRHQAPAHGEPGADHKRGPARPRAELRPGRAHDDLLAAARAARHPRTRRHAPAGGGPRRLQQLGLDGGQTAERGSQCSGVERVQARVRNERAAEHRRRRGEGEHGAANQCEAGERGGRRRQLAGHGSGQQA